MLKCQKEALQCDFELLLGVLGRTNQEGLSACTGSGAIWNLQQVQHVGEQFLHAFLTMKHSGAVDKTQSGFEVLVAR